jgi:hypothetical protein
MIFDFSVPLYPSMRRTEALECRQRTNVLPPMEKNITIHWNPKKSKTITTHLMPTSQQVCMPQTKYSLP